MVTQPPHLPRLALKRRINRLGAVALLAIAGAAAAADAAEPVTETLPNGITLIVDAVPGGTHAAIVIQVDAGERDDPQGASGMAHLVEHLMVTAASSQQPAGTAESFFQRYAGQATAQTARSFSLYAGVFTATAEQTAAEIAWWADRFGTLEITAADLAREVPRIDSELTNMRSWPHLAAPNLGQDRADPLAPGHHRGGVIEHVRQITPGDADAWRRAMYRGHAIIVSVAGAIDADPTLDALREHFGALTFDDAPVAIPAPLPDPAHDAGPDAAGPEPLTFRVAQGRVEGTPYVASRTLRTPDLNDPAYPAFAVFMNRLFLRSSFARGNATPHHPVLWQTLDNPRVWTIQQPIPAPEAAAETLDQLLRHTAATPPAPIELETTIQRLGAMLGIVAPDPAATRANPYNTAFVNARCHRTHAIRRGLAEQIRAVDADAWARFRDEVLPQLPAADLIVIHPTE